MSIFVFQTKSNLQWHAQRLTSLPPTTSLLVIFTIVQSSFWMASLLPDLTALSNASIRAHSCLFHFGNPLALDSTTWLTPRHSGMASRTLFLSPQIVGGQMPLQQASPTVLHLSPGQSNVSQGRPGFTTVPSVTSMSGPNRFPVVSSSSTAHPSLGSAVQSGTSVSNFTGDPLTQPNRTPVPVSVSHRLPISSSKSTSTFSNTPGAGTQQQFFCQVSSFIRWILGWWQNGKMEYVFNRI